MMSLESKSPLCGHESNMFPQPLKFMFQVLFKNVKWIVQICARQQEFLFYVAMSGRCSFNRKNKNLPS